MMIKVVIFALYLALAIILGLLGEHRKFGFWGYFFGSLALTPLASGAAVDRRRPGMRRAGGRLGRWTFWLRRWCQQYPEPW